ncbi:hypothetical protein HanRHA438_Chr07g0289631 [Helianthus annuus]|nr:hypothetical protein HanRHA438_Chr07g0289631 [Helianthus annuus]
MSIREIRPMREINLYFYTFPHPGPEYPTNLDSCLICMNDNLKNTPQTNS